MYQTFLLAIKGATFFAVTMARNYQCPNLDMSLAKNCTFVIFGKDRLFRPLVIITSSEVIGRESK